MVGIIIFFFLVLELWQLWNLAFYEGGYGWLKNSCFDGFITKNSDGYPSGSQPCWKVA